MSLNKVPRLTPTKDVALSGLQHGQPGTLVDHKNDPLSKQMHKTTMPYFADALLMSRLTPIEPDKCIAFPVAASQ